VGYVWRLEKKYQQLSGRHAAPFIRDVMARFRREVISVQDAVGELDLSRSQFYRLYAHYLRACAERRQRSWQPGSSGGDQRPDWPAEVAALVSKLLRARPPASYSFAASEVHRRFGVKMDRATIRRWALPRGLAPDTRYKAPRKPVRRWQVQQIGQLWQYDASPHRWFANSADLFPLLQIIDDHSRVLPFARFYPRETLLAHLDFLSSSFLACGLPLALYVDYHSFFFTHQSEAFTQLGAALRFYEVSLRYAPPPQAKGKIERAHDFWQKRLPALFVAEQVFTLPEANALLEQLRLHHNAQEKHREIGSTPKAAWDLALREKRSALRPTPRCPWWPYVWSQRSFARIDPDGRIAIASQRLRIDRPPGSKVIRCLHPNGDHSTLAAAPVHGLQPILLLHSPAPNPVAL
jgi:hypothetical protein